MVASAAAPATADNGSRIAELGHLLTTSSSAKTRISAVAALGRLGDKRAWKPLVGALKDPNSTVRALAAVTLGKLGHKGALPALGEATIDTDLSVRRHATDAILAIRKANNMAPPTPPATSSAIAAARAGHAGFGTSPRAVDPAPDLYVVIKSASDDSPSRLDRTSRKLHGDILRNALSSALRGDALVTTDAAAATRYGLDARIIDLSVVKIEQREIGMSVEVEAQVRLAVSDGQGRMLSVLSGGAMVQVGKKKFDPRFLPSLRREALENAVRGMFDKFVAHLRRDARS